MKQEYLSNLFDNFSDYDTIINELCNDYIALDFSDDNTICFIHYLIIDIERSVMFLMEEILYHNETEKNIKKLIK